MSAIRTVSSGDWGLDLALGGGVPLVVRGEDGRESATMLVRGGPGAGKTTLALQTAVELAAKRDGHVAYACVELLPSELVAQRASIWSTAERPQPITASAPIDIAPFQPISGSGVHVLCSVLPIEHDRRLDAFGEGLEALLVAARTAGGKPSVLVIDSISPGYGLSNAPREYVDAVAKLAVKEGLIILALEEGVAGEASEWSYAVDIVIELDHLDRADAQLERKLWVVKNRFGGSALGPHRFSILRGQGVRIFPAPITYSTPWARDTLLLPSRSELEPPTHPADSWRLGTALTEAMNGARGRAWPEFEDCSVLITGPDADVVRAIARAVGARPGTGADLWIDVGNVDLSFQRLPTERSADWVIGLGVPYLSSQRLVYMAVDALRRLRAMNASVRRILIGDVAAFQSYLHDDDLLRGLIVLLGAARRANLPVVMFQSAAPRIVGEWHLTLGRSVRSTGVVLPAIAEHADAVLEVSASFEQSRETMYVARFWHRLLGVRIEAFADRRALMSLESA